MIYLQLSEAEEEALERMILLFIQESYSPFDIPHANAILSHLLNQRRVRIQIAADREAAHGIPSTHR